MGKHFVQERYVTWDAGTYDGWEDKALCREVDPELFYPVTYQRGAVMAAQRVCNRCPVKDDCLDRADMIGEMRHGIWGGLAPDDRSRLRYGGTVQTCQGCGYVTVTVTGVRPCGVCRACEG